MKFPLLFVFLLFLSSCHSQKEPTKIEGMAMTIPYKVLIGDKLNEETLVFVETLILTSFSEINDIYNDWNPDSEISKFNQLSANENFSPSSKLSSFLKRVDAIVEFTEGRFDPTVQKKGSSEGVGWHHLHFENGVIWKDHPQTKIDLGGIAKGFAVDLLLENLQKAGFQNIYVEWGGEIKAVGHHPSKRKWKVAIFGLSETVELDDNAIATSGNYLQNWKKEDKVYTHILNPATNEPLLVTETSVNSVSVLSETCFEADGLATALMVFPNKEEARQWAKECRIKIWLY